MASDRNRAFERSVRTINSVVTGKSKNLRWFVGADVLDQQLSRYTFISTKTIKLNYQIQHIN